MIPQYLSNTPDTPQCPSNSNQYPPKTHIHAGGIGLGPGLGPRSCRRHGYGYRVDIKGVFM